jgi:GABA(A) receptor-associated protein
MENASYLFDKYPDRIPVIITKKVRDPLDDLDKNKYLIPKDMIFWQFLCILRKRMQMPASKALFVLSNHGRLISNSSLVSVIYESEKSSDGYLRLVYASENAFGARVTPVNMQMGTSTTNKKM